MSTLVAFLTDDHRACDERLAEVEDLVQAGRWESAVTAWSAFGGGVRCHFAREEEQLFPAFENATGGAEGPTAVMRMEHAQMRALFGQIDVALAAADARRFLSLSDTLMVLMQQHNMKEEQILYPMSEQVIPDVARVLAAIAAMAPV